MLPFLPEMVQRARDLQRVRDLWARLEAPAWMPDPHTWVWRRPDGRPAGLGALVRTNPGMANLLWLAMDLPSPPACYDTARNGLYQMLLLNAGSTQLAGSSLDEIAGLLPLATFAGLLAKAPGGAGVEQFYPLLRMLALGRLAHVDT